MMADENGLQVRFASQKMEDDFEQLAESEHQEDRRLFGVLKQTRETLLREYRRGKRVPGDSVPMVYRELFGIENLWSLDIPDLGTVFFSIFEKEIVIVDQI